MTVPRFCGAGGGVDVTMLSEAELSASALVFEELYDALAELLSVDVSGTLSDICELSVGTLLSSAEVSELTEPSSSTTPAERYAAFRTNSPAAVLVPDKTAQHIAAAPISIDFTFPIVFTPFLKSYSPRAKNITVSEIILRRVTLP